MNELTLAIAAAGAAAYVLVVRPWHLRRGGSEDGGRKPSPGDERVLDSRLHLTRAVRVRRAFTARFPNSTAALVIARARLRCPLSRRTHRRSTIRGHPYRIMDGRTSLGER